MIKYSIIIPSFNPSFEHLKKTLIICLEKLFLYTLKENKEIIIVANGCNKDTYDYLKNLKNAKWYFYTNRNLNKYYLFKNFEENEWKIKIIWSYFPLGFSKSNNLASFYAEGEYLIFLNNDAFLLEQEKDLWIKILEEPFLKTELNAGISGPLKNFYEPLNEDFIVCFCAMIRKDVFLKIDKFDEIYQVGGAEDIDLCLKLKELKYKIYQVPLNCKIENINNIATGSFPIFHLGESTVEDLKCVENWNKIFNKNHDILYKKWK